ncbi:MAG TPA: helix-turn-helix domain-containing protein [Mycobacterium sp.]|jgi:AcrR family transcriptional regulator|nr:helix-turn-helix domain-containing protein [Mycobacterium sp.]
MGRRPLHSTDLILDAARELVLQHGTRAATLQAIGEASGAPKGSLYHRFDSRDDLLAEVWMRAVRRSQQRFIDAIQEHRGVAAAAAGALSMFDFAVREPSDAQLLASVRYQDLIENSPTPAVRRSLSEINQPLRAALDDLAAQLFGRASPQAVDVTECAVIDLPMGVIRRSLLTRSGVSPRRRGQLEAAVRAALAEAGAVE